MIINFRPVIPPTGRVAIGGSQKLPLSKNWISFSRTNNLVKQKLRKNCIVFNSTFSYKNCSYDVFQSRVPALKRRIFGNSQEHSRLKVHPVPFYYMTSIDRKACSAAYPAISCQDCMTQQGIRLVLSLVRSHFPMDNNYPLDNLCILKHLKKSA